MFASSQFLTALFKRGSWVWKSEHLPVCAWYFYFVSVLKWMRCVCYNRCLFNIALSLTQSHTPQFSSSRSCDTGRQQKFWSNLLTSSWSCISSTHSQEIIHVQYFYRSFISDLFCSDKEMCSVKGKTWNVCWCKSDVCYEYCYYFSPLLFHWVICYCTVCAYCWIQFLHVSFCTE